MSQSVIGWVDAYLSDYETTPLTNERKKALIERVRKRKYNFTYESHQNLPYASPFYQDKTHCVLTREQWNDVINEAYKDSQIPPRLMPMDVITRAPKNGVLFEKEKFELEGETTDG